MNLYNNKEFDKKKYQWDQTAKKKAKKYQIIQKNNSVPTSFLFENHCSSWRRRGTKSTGVVSSLSRSAGRM